MSSIQTRILAALIGICVLVAIAVVVVIVAGGGDSEDSTGSADEIAQKVVDAINKPGMVYYADGSDGSLTWIDAEHQKYKGKTSVLAGGVESVGSGWTEYQYDPATNAVSEKDNTPVGQQAPRINDPMVRWMEPLSALAFGDVLTVVGRQTSDGVEVIVLDASTPVVDDGGNVTGTLFGRVEIDASTYLPHAFQRRTVLANGVTPTPVPEGTNPHVTYTSQFIDRTTLAGDFFDKSAVQGEIKTNQTEMDAVRELGLTPAWLGLYYDGTPFGELQLPPTLAVIIDDTKTEATIHYALVSPTIQSEDVVIIRLSDDATTFTHPSIPQFAGDLPETDETVTLADGTQATVYTSILTTDAVPCPSGVTCPHSDAKLYRRLVFQRGDTAIQIEVSPRIADDGSDNDGFNSADGIVSLANALVDVPAELGQ